MGIIAIPFFILLAIASIPGFVLGVIAIKGSKNRSSVTLVISGLIIAELIIGILSPMVMAHAQGKPDELWGAFFYVPTIFVISAILSWLIALCTRQSVLKGDCRIVSASLFLAAPSYAIVLLTGPIRLFFHAIVYANQ